MLTILVQIVNRKYLKVNPGASVQLMKPKFTVVRDESTRCFLLFIRGAISVKDRLTAATAAEVPFHHAVSQESRGTSVVVGHAHCGMLAAARWIADQAIPCISRAVELFPDYRIKVGNQISSEPMHMCFPFERFAKKKIDMW
jgi:hypothetical protein